MMTTITTPVREGFAPFAVHVSALFEEAAGMVTTSFRVFTPAAC